jgi:hypothetical protein
MNVHTRQNKAVEDGRFDVTKPFVAAVPGKNGRVV